MKRNQAVLLFLAFVSIVSGYLMSKASLIGKVGMSVFYREYNFLKSWWKGSGVVLLLLLILFATHQMIQKKLRPETAKIFHLIAFGIGVLSLYFTYNDFRHTLSHRLLGERFHLGIYLFWLGWIVISLAHLVHPRSGAPTIAPGNLPGENAFGNTVHRTETADKKS